MLDTGPLSVSELVEQLKDLVEATFAQVWVAGEVTSLTKAGSGHWYFTLKDSEAQIKAAMFRGSNMRVKFDLKNGQEVIARGRASIYAARGEMQLIVEELQPRGLGAAELALRQLKEKLLKLGYFSPDRKRPLPRYPRRVGLVTSASGAAVRDMIELFAQRWPYTELVLAPSRVQGDGAGAEIAQALRMLNRLHAAGALPLDAIVVGRGGGSMEDLSAFNEEEVATAIFESAVPVVSAVGHEIDVTIADLVADHRAETPSAAVMALAPDRCELLQDVAVLHVRLTGTIERRLLLTRERLDALAGRPALRRPLQRVRDLAQRVDELGERLHRSVRQRLVQVGEGLAGRAARLETLSPLNVLTRGYSLTQTEQGKLVRSAADVKPGDLLATRVARGSITSRVLTAESAQVGSTPVAEGQGGRPPTTPSDCDRP